MQFLNNLNLNKNQLISAVIENLAIAPTQPVKGLIYFDTTEGLLKYWDGQKWVSGKNLTSTEIVQLINDGTLKINKNKIEGLAEALDEASMAGDAIVTGINERDTKTLKINAEAVDGLAEVQEEVETLKTLDGRVGEIEDGLQSKLDTTKQNALEDSKSYTDSKIQESLNALKNGVGSNLDTLKEIEDYIERNRTDIDALKSGVKKFVKEIGDSVALEHTITHNLNTQDVVVSLREVASPYSVVLADIDVINSNAVKIKTSVAIPTSAKIKVTVIG